MQHDPGDPAGPRRDPHDAPPDPVEPDTIRRHLETLARPRMTGSEGARTVEAEIRDRFRLAGYETTALGCSFSTLPGVYGLPAAGASLVVMAAGSAWPLASGQPLTALVVLVAGILVAALPLLLLGPAMRLPWRRVETANLLFTRGTPRWIVMAHRDSKSQRAPTLVRTLALAAAVVAWGALVALAAVGVAGGAAGPAWTAGAWVAAGMLGLTGGVLLASRPGNRSPGALDNATGLAALLSLAERVPPDVGFLVTDGEELGLAGARAACGRLPAVEGVINLDGLDDPGPIRIAEGRETRDGRVGALAGRLLEAARAEGLAAVRRPLPPFLMVDHQPLSAAGLPAVTLLKGDWRSLLRVHRPSDSADRITGVGAAAVATLVGRALLDQEGRDAGTLRPRERSGHSPAP